MKPSAPSGVSKPDNDAAGTGLGPLVSRFQGGDGTVFDEIVERFSPRLYSIALRTLGNAEAAEEAVQESWVRIYRKLGALQDPKAFEGWAIRVTLSRIHDEFRARTRERTAREGLADIRRAMGSSPERLSVAEREDLAKVLRAGLASLDDAHREVFILREVEGLPHADIARTLQIPEGTVWSRLSYARRSLREYLNRRKDDVA